MVLIEKVEDKENLKGNGQRKLGDPGKQHADLQEKGVAYNEPL